MDHPTTIIRDALHHALFLGAHSDLPWFTTLQQRALVALEAIEMPASDHKCTCGVSDKDNDPMPLRTAPCAWPREEGCER